MWKRLITQEAFISFKTHTGKQLLHIKEERGKGTKK